MWGGGLRAGPSAPTRLILPILIRKLVNQVAHLQKQGTNHGC